MGENELAEGGMSFRSPGKQSFILSFGSGIDDLRSNRPCRPCSTYVAFIVKSAGFDPVWFGIIITLTMEMSLITPPVGVNVFVLHGVARDIPMNTMFKGVLPFWGAMLVCIVVLIIFPQIVTFLPNSMN